MQSLVNEKLPKEKHDALQRDYLRPENYPDLVAPKITKHIWEQLKQDTKNRDSSLQELQATLMSSLYAMLQVCNNLASSQMQNYIVNWKRITSDPFILDVVAHCHIDFEDEPLLRSNIARLQCTFSTSEQIIIDNEIEKVLEKGIIEPSIY